MAQNILFLFALLSLLNIGKTENDRGLYSCIKSRDIVIIDFREDTIMATMYHFLMLTGALQNSCQNFFIFDLSNQKLVQLKDDDNGMDRTLMHLNIKVTSKSLRSRDVFIDNAHRFLVDLQKNMSEESKGLLQSDKLTILCSDCPTDMYDLLLTLKEGPKWDIVILLPKYGMDNLMFSTTTIDWLPYHLIFYLELSKVKFDTRSIFETWKDIKDVLINPSYNRFTYFAHEKKITCSNRILMKEQRSLHCTTKFISSVTSRMNVQIVVDTEMDARFSYFGILLGLYKLKENVSVGSPQAKINDIMITDGDNGQLIMSQNHGQSVSHVFKCYGDNYELVEKLMTFCVAKD